MAQEANTSVGNNNSHCVTINATGSIAFTQVQTAQVPPQKPWFSTQPLGKNNHLPLLRWDRRVCERVGRDAEFEELLAWTDDGNPGIQARLITGDGGTGKSRLAGDLAQELVKRGWRAEKLADRLTEQVVLPLGEFQPREGAATLGERTPTRQSVAKPAYKGGLLIVIDYPEGRMPLVERLLESLRDYAVQEDIRVRLLLLSRRDSQEWDSVIERARAEGLFQTDAIHLGRPIDPAAQFVTILSGVAMALKQAPPTLPAGEPDKWLSNNRAYQQPLFMAAVALHFCLHPEAGLTLGGPEAVTALVKRERSRAQNESSGLGWDPDTLPRLLALATLRGGLNSAKLNELGQMLGVPAGSDICDRLRHGCDGRIRDNVLPPLEPDLPGAAFATLVLSERVDMAPEWIWRTISDNPMGLVPRLEQVCHDAEGTLQLLSDSRISRLLVAMVAGRPDRAEALRQLAFSDDHSHRLANLAAIIGQVLLENKDLDLDSCARLHNNRSVYLSDAGDREGALEASYAAVNIYEKLAADSPGCFDSDLACCLSNLSVRLLNIGDGLKALNAVGRAVEIRQKLAGKNLCSFDSDLAESLNNLSVQLSNIGEVQNALEVSYMAVEICQRLVTDNPTSFNNLLAKSLDNLSTRLSEFGKSKEALEAICKAVKIRRKLADDTPSRFNHDLASSLNNLSLRLSDVGDEAAALDAIAEAVEIYQKLAAENPSRFNPILALILSNFSISLANSGNMRRALETNGQAVEIYTNLAINNPPGFSHDLAGSLHNLSLRLSDVGDKQRALEAIRSGVEIYQVLAAAKPKRFNPELASSLNNLSARLSDMDDIPGALDAGQKAVAIFQTVATENPDRFNPELAGSLATLAQQNFRSGNLISAIDQMEWAIALITPQANAYPGSQAGLWLSRMRQTLARWRHASTPP